MEREHPPTNMAMLGHTVLKLELVQTTTPKHMFTDTKHSTHISYHSSVNFTWRHIMAVMFSHGTQSVSLARLLEKLHGLLAIS